MADCLLLNTLIRTIRANRTKRQRRSDDTLDNDITIQAGPTQFIKTNLNGSLKDVIAFPDVGTYESSCQDVANIKNQVLELQRLITQSASTVEMKKNENIQLQHDDIRIERLIEENMALRRELLEKEEIIKNLKAQLKIN